MNQRNKYSRIHFTETGTGPILVLIPGLGLNTHIFDDIVRLLAPQYHCLCVEFSGNVPAKERINCSIESLAQEVHRFLLHHKWIPHAVIGHSLGGFVAMHLALLAPAQVPQLILLSSAAHGDPSLFDLFIPPKPTSPHSILEHNMAMCVTDSFKKSSAFKRAMAHQLDHSGSGKCFIPLLRGATRFNFVDKLPTIKSRTLIIWGKEDNLSNAAQTQLLTEGIPNNQTIFLDNVGHLPQIEAPEQTADAIARFLGQ